MRPLMLRVNRLLGANLTSLNLLSPDDLDRGNQLFLDTVDKASGSGASLLRILLWELRLLEEEKLLQYLSEEKGYGMVELARVTVAEDIAKQLDPVLCRITATVPFYQEDGFWMLASAYLLSPAVIQHWENELKGNVLWYATDLGGVISFLDKVAPVQEEEADSEEALKSVAAGTGTEG